MLVVEGDNQSNQIRIVDDTPGQARIEGLDGTTVNGMAADEVFSGFAWFSWIRVDLGNGDDTLTYESAGVRVHATTIAMGNGDDTVTVLAHDDAFWGPFDPHIAIATGNVVTTTLPSIWQPAAKSRDYV